MKTANDNKIKESSPSSASVGSASLVEVLTANNCEKYPPTKTGGIIEAFSMAAARAMGLKRDGIKVEVKWKP